MDIPTAMRGYMYAYGYRNMPLAREALVDAGLDSNPCANCSTCSVSCRQGFDVRAKLTDIARLQAVPEEFLG